MRANESRMNLVVQLGILAKTEEEKNFVLEEISPIDFNARPRRQEGKKVL